jgi:hypothetical protein
VLGTGNVIKLILAYKIAAFADAFYQRNKGRYTKGTPLRHALTSLPNIGPGKVLFNGNLADQKCNLQVNTLYQNRSVFETENLTGELLNDIYLSASADQRKCRYTNQIKHFCDVIYALQS